MMSNFGGREALMTSKNWTLEGKNWTWGGGGVKNHQKLSDIIYVRSLRLGIIVWLLNITLTAKLIEFSVPGSRCQ